jgi:hypothetical protein
MALKFSLNNKQILYDGLETEKLYQMIFEVCDITFKISNFTENPVDKLKTLISNDHFSQLAALYNSNSEFLKYFKDYPFDKIPLKSEENLSLYFLLKNNSLYLFSFGEKQPGRYMLFLEGVWDL